MKQNWHDILNKPVSRKQFLGQMGAIALAFAGIGSITGREIRNDRLALGSGSASSGSSSVSAGVDHTTSADPSSVRLSDGTNFYNATTPADTQPVSAASLPLPAGAATEVTLKETLSALSTANSTLDDLNSKLGGTLKISSSQLPASLGQTTMAGSLPVTLASNQSTIDVNVVSGGTGGGPADLQVRDSGGTWTDVGYAGGNQSLPTTFINSSGTEIGTNANPIRINPTGTTTQPVSGTVTVGNASIPVTQSGNWSSRTLDGSGNSITSTSNALDVNIKSGGGSGFSVADEAAWTAGSSAFVPSGGAFNDSATALTSGQQGTLRLTNNRALHSNLRNASGTEIGTSSNPIRTDPTGATTQPVSGSVAATQSGTWLTRLEDGSGNTISSTSNALDVNIKSGGSTDVQYAEGATAATATGTLALGKNSNTLKALQTDSSGNLEVVFPSAQAVSQSGTWNVGTLTSITNVVHVDDNSSTLSVDDGGGSLTVDGTVAATQSGNWSTRTQDGSGNAITSTSSALDINIKSGNPTTIAATQSGTWNVGASTATGSTVPANAFYSSANAITSLPTAATAGNLTGISVDKFGRVVTAPGTIRDLVGTQTTTISASTSETTIVTGAANVFNDITLLLFSNTSGTATRIDIRDTTAGTILGSVYVPAGDMRGFSLGGAIIPQTSVNTNWTAQCATSVTDIRVYAVFNKNK